MILSKKHLVIKEIAYININVYNFISKDKCCQLLVTPTFFRFCNRYYFGSDNNRLLGSNTSGRCGHLDCGLLYSCCGHFWFLFGCGYYCCQLRSRWFLAFFQYWCGICWICIDGNIFGLNTYRTDWFIHLVQPNF